MPKVHHVKKARKDQGNGIKVGDSYYWWKFAFGPRMVSKTYPKPSQLTRSEFLGTLYTIQDSVEALVAKDSLHDDLESIINEIRTLGEECEEKRENMPEQLQDVGAGEILMERSEAMESWAPELDSIDFDEDSGDLEKYLQEIQGMECSI